MPRAGLSRERIIAAAAEQADAQGFETLTLAQLARLFGVQLPTLYSHLANLDDLKKGVALLALSELADRVEEAIGGRSGKEALQAFADAHRHFAADHPGLFAAARHPLDAETAAHSAGMRLGRLSLSMLRGYGLSEADAVHATRLVGSFVLGFSLLDLSKSFAHSQPNAIASWHKSLESLDQMLRSWTSH